MNENKKGYLSNIKSFLKNKTDGLKEKFPTIFKKPNEENAKAQQAKQEIIQKPIFTIEEDEDHKIYNYHDDDEDDYDYVEDGDEIEEEKKESETKTPEKKRKRTDPEIKEQQQPTDEQEVDYEPYDPNTVCHRIYLKDTLIDLDGMTYLKCKRMKASNKLFSMIGVCYV